MVRALAADLLGGHVVDCPHHDVAAGQLRGDEPRQPEVHQLHRPGVRDEDVGRLDVAVNHAVSVGVLQSFANLAGHLQLAAQAHSCRVGHPRREILAGEVLHGQIGLPLVLAEVVDRHDVLVRQLSGGAGFAKEPLAAFLVCLELGGNDLDRDDPL